MAQERERAMRYEMQIARQQQQQRMMMNTFVNMNMMQSQMTNAMFSSMMSPQQQQQPKVGVEKFAMLRSMANRHGVKELSSLPLKQGASAMMGQPVPSMMGPVGSMMPAGSVMPGMMPSPSAMGARMPAKPRMQTPINRYASSISMPYLQVRFHLLLLLMLLYAFVPPTEAIRFLSVAACEHHMGRVGDSLRPCV